MTIQKPKPRTTDRDKIIGRNLRIFREMRGMTQMKLADALDMTYQQIQKYEKGTNRLSAARLYDFSKLLKVKIENFYIDVR